MKFKDIPNPIELLEGDPILEGLNLTPLDYEEIDEDDILYMSILSSYVETVEELNKKRDMPFVNVDEEIKEAARKFISSFAPLHDYDLNCEFNQLEMRFNGLLSNSYEDKKKELDDLEKRLINIKSNLSKKQKMMKYEQHKRMIEEYKKGKISWRQLHIEDIRFGCKRWSDTYRKLWPYVIKLRRAASDEARERFKLEEKSLGHQYLLLLGMGAFDNSDVSRKNRK